MKPEVSVVIAVYNGAKFISETLESILNQTFSNWECIVVDDGSSDDTCIIVERYILKDIRFKIIKTEGGNGPYISANIGIRASLGSYIARTDADDISVPNRFELQLNCLKNNTLYKICAAEHYNLLENGVVLRKRIVSDYNLLKYYLIFKNPILHSSLFVEKKWFEEIGLYPDKRLAQDYFIWCYSLISNKLIILHEPLLYWRISPTSITKEEFTKQGDFAVQINKWYLSNLARKSTNTSFSEILFGSFRNSNKSKKSFFDILDALKLLLEIEKNIEYNNLIRALKNEFLYTILIVNCSSCFSAIKLAFFILTNDISFITRSLIYKVVLKCSFK